MKKITIFSIFFLQALFVFCSNVTLDTLPIVTPITISTNKIPKAVSPNALVDSRIIDDGIRIGYNQTPNPNFIHSTFGNSIIEGTGPSGGLFVIRNPSGTSTPTAPTNGSTTYLGLAGWDGTNYIGIRKAGFRFLTSENWTSTANGCGLSLVTTPNGSISSIVRFRIFQDGRMGAIYGNNSFDGYSSIPAFMWFRGIGNTRVTKFLNYQSANGSPLLTIMDDGAIGIGDSIPSAFLVLKQGNASAGNAPLKIKEGSLLTIPEAGAVEFNSGKWYYTDSTPTRKEFAYVEDVKRPYSSYTVLTSQSGTSSPTTTVLENQLGSATVSRVGVGEYTITITGAFVAGKTTTINGVLVSNVASSSLYISGKRVNDNVYQISTGNGCSSLDGALNDYTLEIRVYD